MNSKTYNQISKDISKKLNKYFSDFCSEYPQYDAIKDDYTKKTFHLNGVQFYAGFVSGPFENWEDHMEVAIAIELVMLWAYKTKAIIDGKEQLWEETENVKTSVLQHDTILSCINDLLDSYTKNEPRSAEKIRSLIFEMLAKLAHGFWIEKEKLNIKRTSIEEAMFNWEFKYIDRNNGLNLVYDYTSLIGFALSTSNFDIIKDYNNEIPNILRFSHVSQIISDLGNFGDDVDKNAVANQDVFSDIKNGILTFPIFHLIKEQEILDAFENPELTKNPDWQKKIHKLIPESNINKEAIKIAAESYDKHKKFFETYLQDPNPLLLKVFGMLINNKYFNQKIVFEESPVLRNRVVLCTNKGKETGTYDKLRAHKEGKLHKAFSIFIFNSKGQHLVQKRADGKYHSAGLWSNTCCSHNISGEKLLVTAKRRLKEEIGIECELEKKFSFVYKIDTGNGLAEHEYDTVLIGQYDGEFNLNPEECSDARWMNTEDLTNDVKLNPKTYTEWFKIILERMGCK